jgi:methyl-galactoside transport system ATP-binding protein
VETLFGIRDRSEGTIKLHGKEVANHNAHEAIQNGFALVTESAALPGSIHASTSPSTP